MEKKWVGFVLLGVSYILAAPQSYAIPAFARKYQFSYSTCHGPFPRLKPFGEEFAARGFRLEDPSQEPTRAIYDVGDPWLQLPREFPLAMRLDGYASLVDSKGQPKATDVEWPWAVKILSGGQLTKSISYYAYGILEKGETIKLEDTWVQCNSVFGLPVDLLAGQFQVSDPLFKRELRLERNDYAIFKLKLGHVPTNLAYDRGLVLSWNAPGELQVVGQVVNGNGIDPAENARFDDNRFKAVSLRLARQFGSTRLGLFGYTGKFGGRALPRHHKRPKSLVLRVDYRFLRACKPLKPGLARSCQGPAEFFFRNEEVNSTGPGNRHLSKGGWQQLGAPGRPRAFAAYAFRHNPPGICDASVSGRKPTPWARSCRPGRKGSKAEMGKPEAAGLASETPRELRSATLAAWLNKRRECNEGGFAFRRLSTLRNEGADR